MKKIIKNIKKIISRFIYRKDKRGIFMIDSEFIDNLKSHMKYKDCNKKYIHISVIEKEDVRESVRRLFQ